MYYIKIKGSHGYLNYMTLNKDASNDLILVDLTTKPYIIEDMDMPITYSSIEQILKMFSEKFSNYQIKYVTIENIFEFKEISFESMTAYQEKEPWITLK